MPSMSLEELRAIRYSSAPDDPKIQTLDELLMNILDPDLALYVHAYVVDEQPFFIVEQIIGGRRVYVYEWDQTGDAYEGTLEEAEQRLYNFLSNNGWLDTPAEALLRKYRDVGEAEAFRMGFV